MRTVHFRSLAPAAVAALAFAASGAAQDRAPELLNTLEVRQLVARAEPADQAQLGAHVTALADRYGPQACGRCPVVVWRSSGSAFVAGPEEIA